MSTVVGGLLLIVALALVVMALVATFVGGVNLRKELSRAAKRLRPRPKQHQEGEGLDKAA